MTVQVEDASAQYVGTGAITTFAIPFEAVEAADITVSLNGQLQSIGYGIVGDVTSPGATVVFATAPAAGVKVDIVRDTPLTQPTIYTPYGPYKAKQIESDFDRMVMMLQEISRLANKPLVIYAVDVLFTPQDHVTSTDVQHAMVEVDTNWRAAIVQVGTDIQSAFQFLVPKATPISSADTDTLVVAFPTLAQEIRLSTRTNIPLGLVKLDATGKIPNTLLQTFGLNFKGVWSEAANGPTPPALGAQGDMYLFDQVGNITLRESANTNPHTVAVFINDYMVYDAVGAVPGWYYVHNAQQQNIAAVSVSFVPVGTLISSNVQAAIGELDASISLRYHENGSESVVERFNGVTNEVVFATSLNGARLLRNSQDKLNTTAQGIDVFGSQVNSVAAQFANIRLLSSDGVPQGRIGPLGDPNSGFYVLSDRLGQPLTIAHTNSSPQIQFVLHAVPDGVTQLFYAGRIRAQVGNAGFAIYGDELISAPTPTNLYGIVSADSQFLARIGFLQTANFYINIDKPNAGFVVALNEGGVMTFDNVQLFVDRAVQANGQFSTNTPAPTAPNHLTRKDYVDAQLSGFTSADFTVASFATPHNLGVNPSQVSGRLINVTAQAGYVPGDAIALPPVLIQTTSSFGYSTWSDATNLGFVRAGVGTIIPKGGGAAVTLIEANWRVRLFAKK